MSNSAKPGMIRLSEDSFVMAHHVTRVVIDYWDETEGSGSVMVMTTDGGCAAVEREGDTLLPMRELVELIARTTAQVIRTGEDVDLRPRMLAPRF